MTERKDAQQIWIGVEAAVTRYCDSLRAQVPGFVERQFTLERSLKLHRATLWHDLIRLPINAIWSIPYLTIKKSAEYLDKMGWGGLLPFVEAMPAGFKTGLQAEVEERIATDLFDLPRHGEEGLAASSALSRAIASDPHLARLRASGELDEILTATELFQKELKKFSIGRTIVSNVSASLTTLVAGWLFFGEGSLGLTGLGSKIAESFARARTASEFPLGEGIGRAYYDLVKPETLVGDQIQAWLCLGFLLAVVSFLTSVIFDPVRRILGLQEKKILKMIDALEESLILTARKNLKNTREHPAAV